MYIAKFDYEQYVAESLLPENKERIKTWTKNKKLQKIWYLKLRIVDGGNSSMEDLLYYDRPVVEKELNGEKVLLYEAWGIPRDTITYSTEFINKTKRLALRMILMFI